ncbi:DAK2 domain-containing protein [Erysipelothrix aquatica]|uniref:DAK2 domain-containing protein n=1 Tax=Erysipelothrix aquatica TaxID=2683714 RepID=UPI001357C150|nr:DAK2 domain-containing protein [Erysipelothrix aquatica]
MELEQYELWIQEFNALIEDNEELLNYYDTMSGDGDHGTNVIQGSEAVLEMMERRPYSDPSQFMKQVGLTLLAKLDGVCGPLYGAAFNAMALHTIDPSSEMFHSGYEAIAKRGQTPRDHPMLKVWRHFANRDVLEVAIPKQYELVEHVTTIANSTDPGAISSYLLFQAWLNVFGK